jgi:hypothetical protein
VGEGAAPLVGHGWACYQAHAIVGWERPDKEKRKRKKEKEKEKGYYGDFTLSIYWEKLFCLMVKKKQL